MVRVKRILSEGILAVILWSEIMNNQIHLDCISSRKMRASAKEQFTTNNEIFANTLTNYRTSNIASEIVENSRRIISQSVGVLDSENLYFTSGPDEAANWAIKGLAWKLKNKNRKFIYTEAESIRIKNPIRWLKKLKIDSAPIGMKNEGEIKLDLEHLKRLLEEDIAALCIEFSNSEIGFTNEIRSIVDIVRDYSPNTKIICDLSTQIGRGELNIDSLGIDLGIIDSQSFGGPNGIGALYINPNTRIENMIHGDHSESGKRSGSQNIALISSMAAAAQEMQGNLENEISHLEEISLSAFNHLNRNWSDCKINTPKVNLDKGILNFMPSRISSDMLVQEMSLKGYSIAQSGGCSSTNGLPSHVLKSIGLSDEEALSSVKFSFDYSTTLEEIENAINILRDIVKLHSY